MDRPFREYLDSLPPERKEAIETRAAELIAEEYGWRRTSEVPAQNPSPSDRTRRFSMSLSTDGLTSEGWAKLLSLVTMVERTADSLAM